MADSGLLVYQQALLVPFMEIGIGFCQALDRQGIRALVSKAGKVLSPIFANFIVHWWL